MPEFSGVAREIALRAVLPTLALGAANVVAGRLLSRSARVRETETALVERLQQARTPTRDAVAKAASTATDVPAAVAHGLAAVSLLAWRTRDWRVAALPGLALALEAGMYVAAGAAVDRPRPDVPHLDHEQPTSSFPSGHVGATVALGVVYWRLSQALPSPLARRVIRAACVLFPPVLGWARTYVGMHYPSDVAAGVVNGLAIGAWASSALDAGR